MMDVLKVKKIKQENFDEQIDLKNEDYFVDFDIKEEVDYDESEDKEEFVYEREDKQIVTEKECNVAVGDFDFIDVSLQSSFDVKKEVKEEDINIEPEEVNFVEFDIKKTDVKDELAENNLFIAHSNGDCLLEVVENQKRENNLKNKVKRIQNSNEQSSSEASTSKLGNKTKLYICEECKYKTKRKGDFNRHLKIHSKKKTLKYDEYNGTRKLILKHTRTQIVGKSYTCSYCDYITSAKSGFQTHIRIHTGERPYQCKECDYVSSQSANLQRHIRKHTGEKPYDCKYCDYKASVKSTLEAHVRIHTGDRPFRCTNCDFTASTISTLQGHIKIHTGEKPFTCHYCNYKTARKLNLKNHIRTFHQND